jgi:hypothetical protein
MGSPRLPWLRVEEVGETQGYEAPESDGLSHYYGQGVLQISVFHAGLKAARDIRRQVIAALNDAPLAFDDGALMLLAVANPSMPVLSEVGPAAAVIYHAIATFNYIVDRTY